MVPRIWLSQVYHRRIFFNTSGRQCRVAWGGGEGGGGEREGVGRDLIYSTYFSDVFTTIGIVKITQHVNLTKSAPCF